MKFSIVQMSMLIIILFTSCGNGNSGSTATKATIGGSGSSDAVFSYTLQGNKISGGAIDDLKLNNIAYIDKSDQKPNIQFFLSDVYNDKTANYNHSLRFKIPANTGTIQLKEDDDKGHVELFIATESEGQYTIYGDVVFTVTVSDISTNRISGTFSGTMKPLTAGPILTIADGKFDLPLHDAHQ